MFKDDEEDTSEFLPHQHVERREYNPKGGGSETCHFCAKRVYVVERMSTEGKFFHRSCFRCGYCNVLLRLSSYVYHREGPFGGRIIIVSEILIRLSMDRVFRSVPGSYLLKEVHSLNYNSRDRKRTL